jgi:hypothetical protein
MTGPAELVPADRARQPPVSLTWCPDLLPVSLILG